MMNLLQNHYHLTSFSEINFQQNVNDLNDIFSEDNSSSKEEIKSNNSGLTEENISGLIGDLNEEIIESAFLSSIQNNNATNFFCEINFFENNI